MSGGTEPPRRKTMSMRKEEWVAIFSSPEWEGAVTVRDGRTDQEICAGLCLPGAMIIYEGPSEQEAVSALREWEALS
jgi:hypothetical protein